MNNTVKHKSIPQMLLSLPVIALLLGLDQWAKYWAYNDLRINGPVTLIKGVFSFTWTQNDGAAWGMMGGNVLLNWLPVLIALVILVFYQRVPMTKRMLPLNILMLLLFSGAVGNRIDRSLYGYVQDFLYFELIDFPIFNIADCYIVVSCIAMIFFFLFYYKDENEFKGVFSFRKGNKQGSTADKKSGDSQG